MRGRAALGRGARIEGRVWVHGGGKVRVGDGAGIDGRELPVELHAERGAEISIGDGVEIGGGTSIEAQAAVTIGAGARIGRLCKILDNNFHAVIGDRGRRPPPAVVVVGAGAVLGDRSILLPGARIAPGTVVRAGAVVRGPVPRAAVARPLPGPARSRCQNRVVRMSSKILCHPIETLRDFLGLVRGRIVFSRHERGRGIRVYGDVRVVREGTIRVDDRATFIRGMTPTLVVVRAGGSLVIGEACVFNYGVSIEASSEVRIGRRCMFGSSVHLHDRDGDRVAPITIGDDVWLAHGVVIAPGVTVGAGSVVSAGSAVMHDVPPGSLAAGNPARAVPLSLAVPTPAG